MCTEVETVGSFDLQAVETEIAATQFAGTIVHLASTGSTNTLAIEAAQAGVRCGVWVADKQTAGRGRGGHQWHSAPSEGLYVSALVTPPLAMMTALQLSLAAGLAARAAIKKVTGLKIDLRWPNDLMLNGKKCGGILVETAVSNADGDAKLRYAVIGVGINLNHRQFPAGLEQLATSLRIEQDRAVSREAMLASLLCALDDEIQALIRDESGERLRERFTQSSS